MVIICPGTLLNISNWYPVILRRTYYKPWRFLIAQNDIQEKIKKPPNAFVLFVLKMKETLPDSCRGKRIITPELGKMWNELPEDEKEKYREQYRQGMAKYEKQLLEYSETFHNKDMHYKIAEFTSKNVSLRKQKLLLGKPRKPPSTFLMFYNDMKKLQKGNSAKPLYEVAQEAWYNMDEAEKLAYKKRHEIEINEYREKLSQWEKDMSEQGFFQFVRTRTSR